MWDCVPESAYQNLLSTQVSLGAIYTEVAVKNCDERAELLIQLKYPNCLLLVLGALNQPRLPLLICPVLLSLSSLTFYWVSPSVFLL